MLYIEPLMILPQTKYLPDWYNPNIDNLTKKLEIDDNGNLMGSLVRAHFSFSKVRTVDIISLTDDLGIDSMLTKDGPNNFGSQLLVLFTKIWEPGGKKFYLSEYGEIFNNIFPFYHDVFGGFYSNNISIAQKDDGWTFIEEM